MESYKLLVLISKQDLNYLNDWHKFEMFRKLIKSLEETSFSLKKFPNPPNPVRNNVFNPIEYNNILKLRVFNINQHEVKITGFQRAQLLIEQEKNEISRQQLRWQQITGSAKGVVVVAGAAVTFVLLYYLIPTKRNSKTLEKKYKNIFPNNG